MCINLNLRILERIVGKKWYSHDIIDKHYEKVTLLYQKRWKYK